MIEEKFKTDEMVINQISLRGKFRLSLKIKRCNLSSVYTDGRFPPDEITIKFVINDEPMKVYFRFSFGDISSSNYDDEYITYFIKPNTLSSTQVYTFLLDIKAQSKEGIFPASMQKR